MNNNKPFGNLIDFSNFIVPNDNAESNIFMQNRQNANAFMPQNNMNQAAVNSPVPNTGTMNAQNMMQHPAGNVAGYNQGTANRGENVMNFAAGMNRGNMSVEQNVGAQAPAGTVVRGAPFGIPELRANMVQPNGKFGSSNSNPPVEEILHNPHFNHMNMHQQASVGSQNYNIEATMQGPVVPVAQYLPNQHQFLPHQQMQNTPGIFPSAMPGFPAGYGMGRRTSKKGVKVSAYDIMTDFIKKVPVFTHKQEVYVYNCETGSYNKMPQCEVEQMIMEMYRPIIQQSGNGTLIEKTYKLLLKEPRIVRNEVPLSDPNKISFANCTVDLNSRMLMEHSPANVVTHALNCDLARYGHQSEETPVFDKLLQDITGGDTTLIERILQVIGYCLTSDRSAKYYFLLQGCPDSGKTLLCNLLGDFYSEDKVSALNVHSLKGEFAMGNLESVALCMSPDLPPEPLDVMSTSCVKQVTGNDKISAAVKHKGNKQFRFEGKMILTTNYPLMTEEPDEAFMRRAVVIPFFYTIPKESQDTDLLDRLKKEKPAIASKVLDAYFRLRDNHYKFAGDYAINSCVLYPDDVFGGDEITPMLYNFMVNRFEKDPNGEVAVGEAYEVFSREVSNQFSEKMFSSAMQRLAEEIYGASKTRSYHNGKYLNARSTIEGIRFKNMNR